MASWPSGDDLIKWIGAPMSQAALAVADEVVASAIAATRARLEGPTVVWGEEEIPDDVRQAVLLDAARQMTRRESANGVIATQELAVRLGSVDPDIERLLRPYTRWLEA